MAERDAAHIATTIIVVQAGATLAGILCPAWYTVCAPDFHAPGARDANVLALRRGYRVAAGLTLLTGAVAAALVGSAMPLAAAAVVAAVEVGGYEYAVRHPAGS